ncbi:hypothetical protein [Nocardioides humi]|uniref:RDD family protein n=1 Tax=Nocardioides humi TaxID=449461 RepID=A0ABN2ATJ7_9ACTN|nr:hypothetical protein [Nocardioides humi]
MHALTSTDATFDRLDALALAVACGVLPLAYAVALLCLTVLPAGYLRANTRPPGLSATWLGLRCWQVLGPVGYVVACATVFRPADSAAVTAVFTLAALLPLLGTARRAAGSAGWRDWASRDAELGRLPDASLDHLGNQLFLRTFARRVRAAPWLTAGAMLLYVGTRRPVDALEAAPLVLLALALLTILYDRVLEQLDPLGALIVLHRHQVERHDDFLCSTDPWRHGEGRAQVADAPLVRLAQLRLQRLTRTLPGPARERARAGCAELVDRYLADPPRLRGDLLRTCVDGPLPHGTVTGTSPRGAPWDATTLLTLGGAAATIAVIAQLVAHLGDLATTASRSGLP